VPATLKYLFARSALGAASASVLSSVKAAMIDPNLVIVFMINLLSSGRSRFENWGRGLKASASPRAVDIFGRRAQSTSSAIRVVERFPQMFRARPAQ
jgi:hypothetical protein